MSTHLQLEQGSREWMDARLAKFTSSELHKLFKSGRSKTEYFGETAKTYIQEKVGEIMTNGLSAEAKLFESNATEWGTFYENEARERFESLTGLPVTKCGFFEYNRFFGGSPDGLVDTNDILEIKCPYNAKNHVLNLACNSEEDLKTLNPEYYIQIQGNMLATGAKNGFFVSYDPRFTGDFQIKIILVKRNEEMIAEILERLDKAAEYMNELLTKAMNL